MGLRLITEPTVEPLSLAEVKEYLRITDTDEDASIRILIKAARKHIEGPYGFLGRALVTQTWELVLDEFPANEIKIPLPPLQSITSIKYDDGDGNETTLADTEYTVDNVSEPGWVVPVSSGSWPTTFEGINAVRIRFVAGYESAANSPVDSPAEYSANVPDDIRSAMLLLIGSMYEHREEIQVGSAAVALPWGAIALLRPHRIHLGMA